MANFEYRVVPAPKKGARSWGLKSSEDRFATALAKVMNDLAAEGWEYQRSDTLPCEEKSGFRGKSTVFQNMLVFRREREAGAAIAPVAAPLVAEPRLSRTEPEPAQTERAEPPISAEAPPERTSDVVLPVFMRGAADHDKKPDLAAE
jgi:Domain of unknown function (DUF4177)